MANFRGYTQGQRGQAARLGSKGIDFGGNSWKNRASGYLFNNEETDREQVNFSASEDLDIFINGLKLTHKQIRILSDNYNSFLRFIDKLSVIKKLD